MLSPSPTTPESPNEKLPVRTHDLGVLPIPRYCRFNPNLAPEDQPKFSWRMNLVFALAATASVMNVYFAQPMLVDIANDLDVSHDAVAHIPTLAQAGYGVGILLIAPLGDLLRRRQLLLVLFGCTACINIGLALVKKVATLQGLSFLIAIVSITPQICVPWTADLAPSNIRARSASVTLSGLICGLVIGRLIGGVLSTFASWRDAYWFGVAFQATMLGVLWVSLPDTPDKGLDISYPRFMGSMFMYLYKYPTLLQASLCFCFSSAVFGGFWTTTTFVLSNAPYNFSPFKIGLFGLLGILGAILAPQWGRLVDCIVPWTGQVLGFSVSLCAMIIALGGADKNIACVCIPMILYDVGMQLAQVATVYRIQGLEPEARSRMNGIFLLLMFAGQTSGTAVMTSVYNSRGWTLTGATAVMIASMPLILLSLRGPHEVGWIGWGGGTQLIKRDKLTDLSPTAITEYGKKGKPPSVTDDTKIGSDGSITARASLSGGKGATYKRSI